MVQKGGDLCQGPLLTVTMQLAFLRASLSTAAFRAW